MRVAVGEHRCGGAVRAEPAVRVGGHVGDGIDRDAELGRDVLVRSIPPDAVEDEAFALGQRMARRAPERLRIQTRLGTAALSGSA